MIPRSARVSSYPVVERYHWLWIWMGDPALADPAKITDYHWLDDPNWGAKGQYLHVKGNWQLVVDNLLDLTHLAFVHETTIGNSALVDQAQVKVQRTPGQRDRDALDHRRAGAADLREGRRLHRQRRSLADHRFHPAGVPASRRRRDADRHRRAGGHSASAASACGISTPSRRRPRPPATTSGARRTISTSHNPKTTDMIIEQIRTAFLEDVAVFEAQQRNLQLDSQSAADRHQRRHRRDPGAPHPRPALPGGAGRRSGEDGGGGVDGFREPSASIPGL